MVLDQLGSWLLLNAVVFSVIVLSSTRIRDHLAPAMVRLGSWTFAHLRPVAEVDQEADYLWNVLRRQRLAAHVQRLQRILASDQYMSATRQIANRIAYAQLLSELRSTPDFEGAMPTHGTPTQWNPSAHPAWTERPTLAPAVEILDIGWRRQRSKPPLLADRFDRA